MYKRVLKTLSYNVCCKPIIQLLKSMLQSRIMKLLALKIKSLQTSLPVRYAPSSSSNV